MFRVIGSTTCRGGNCPTVLLDEATGAVLVQGYEPAADELSAVGPLPNGEAVVRIPISLLLEAAQAAAGGPR